MHFLHSVDYELTACTRTCFEHYLLVFRRRLRQLAATRIAVIHSNLNAESASRGYSLLLLGYKPVQHVTVLNTVGSCNTVVL
jgi:hypothetical protein